MSNTTEQPKPSRSVALAARTILNLKPRELKDLAALLVAQDIRHAGYLGGDLQWACAASEIPPETKS